MKLSPLQMAYYRLADFSLTPRVGITIEDEPYSNLEEMEAFLEIYQEGEDGDFNDVETWGVTLGLMFKADEQYKFSPYDFKIVLFGTFKCAKNLPQGLKVERLVGVNGSSMLYGVARELIGTISEKSIWGRLTLPTMAFTDYKDMIVAQDVAAADASTNSLLV